MGRVCSLTRRPRWSGRWRRRSRGWQAAEKMAARRAVEKTRDGKVKKPTFPPSLEIPQTPRDSHFPTASAAAGDSLKPEHFICYEKLQARATLMALCFLSQRNDALRK